MRWRKSSYSGNQGGSCVEVAAWRKASHSGSQGNCVEVGAGWRKASHSSSGAKCVEVARDAAVIGVRDSKDPDGPVLAFAATDWSKFIASQK